MIELFPDLPIISHKQKETIANLKAGEIDDLRVSNQLPIDDIVKFGLKEGFLKEGLKSFPDPRKNFDIPLQMVGSPFQIKVWQELLKIPYGQTISYKEQVSSTDYDELSVLGVDLKRFDFVIETKTKTYFIEVNFYSSNGSKLNEVARSYSDIAPKINSISGFEFVWITDGKGWLSAKNKLEEAYNIIPSTYNLTNIEDFIKLIKSVSVDKKKIILNNLWQRLDSVERFTDYKDDLPF